MFTVAGSNSNRKKDAVKINYMISLKVSMTGLGVIIMDTCEVNVIIYMKKTQNVKKYF